MKTMTLILAVALGNVLFAQEKGDAQVINENCVATYKGGNGALIEYLKQNISYPDECHKNNQTATVVVRFVVELDGSVSNAKVEKVVPADANELFKKEALRVVSSMTQWQSPSCDGVRKERTYYRLPISFKL